MRGLILRLKELEERQKKRTLTLRKHYKIAQAMIYFQKIFSISKSEQTRAGAAKRHGDSIEHIYRKDRKSSRPKFLSER